MRFIMRAQVGDAISFSRVTQIVTAFLAREKGDFIQLVNIRCTVLCNKLNCQYRSNILCYIPSKSYSARL